jgi:hypothetical protein
LDRLRREAKEKELARKAESGRREQIERAKQVRLTKALYIKPLT